MIEKKEMAVVKKQTVSRSVTFTVTETMQLEMKEKAKSLGVTVSEMMRQLFTMYMEGGKNE